MNIIEKKTVPKRDEKKIYIRDHEEYFRKETLPGHCLTLDVPNRESQSCINCYLPDRGEIMSFVLKKNLLVYKNVHHHLDHRIFSKNNRYRNQTPESYRISD